jgi:hypothetical protein
MAFGNVVKARTKSQEFPENTVLFEAEFHSNDSYTYINSTSVNSEPDLYPKDPTLLILFTVAPIFYCSVSYLLLLWVVCLVLHIRFTKLNLGV